ncbi:sensor histidine kinase [Aquihabitans sp. McL0605]|uniref:sensor histidine kinase n=1 Tax=Aquihabitans sp. McL0605 TaxID=3415671 RepID=UPI003CF8EE72
MATRFPIRAKLALALLVPIIAIVAVSIYEVDQATQERDQVQADTALATAALGPGGLIRSMQSERDDSAASMVGFRDQANLKTKSLAGSRQLVDDARAEFGRSVASLGPGAEAVYGPALAKVDEQLAAARKNYDTTSDTGKPASLANFPQSFAAYQMYNPALDALIGAGTRLTLGISDPQLRSSAEMLDTLVRTYEDSGRMTALGSNSALSGGKQKGATKSDVVAQVNQFKQDLQHVGLLATGPYEQAAKNAVTNAGYKKQIKMLDGYTSTGELDIEGVAAAGTSDMANGLDVASKTTGEALAARATTLRSEAADQQRNFSLLAGFTILAGLVFTFLAARSITRPLLSLTRQAEDMATSSLPAAVQGILDTPLGDDVVMPDVPPIEVKTRDEVQDVAAALNSVQQSALDLAVEQAVLRRNISDSFVNLGRRTQSLIARQLDFITELERNETDPAALDNLFKLDHLATRARRNAESLVVLAGLIPPRTWTAPIAMNDVVRAALGEVEDYTRVEIRDIADAMVPGLVAADLVHLLAELLENGLTFSPPGRPVEIYGRMTRNGYVLAVIDHGMGMAPEEMAVANDRLGGRESYTVAPSRYLGHYVAGILADRLGAEVRLDESPTGGIAAKIVVPESTLHHDEAIPAADLGDPAPAEPIMAEPAPALGGPQRSEPRSERSLTGLPRRSGPAPFDLGPVDPAPADPAPVAAAPTLAAAPEPITPAPIAMVPTPVVAVPAPVAAVLAPEPVAAEGPAADGGWGSGAIAADDWKPESQRTTANGLKKRVRGEGLATSGPGRQIRRGGDTDGAAPADRTSGNGNGSADGMFSLLSTFESGSERGREDFGKLLDEFGAAPGSEVPAHGDDDR